MKFKAIVSLCKRSKTVILYDDEKTGTQWIGDGRTIYPLLNFPRLTRSSLFAMIDVPDTKQDTIYYDEYPLPRDLICFDDTDPAENELEPEKIGVSANGILYYPAFTQNGISYVNARSLSPFSDEESGYRLFERVSKKGLIYIAVKVGFMLSGIIFPQTEILTDEFSDRLLKIAKCTKNAANVYALEAEDEEQTSMTV